MRMTAGVALAATVVGPLRMAYAIPAPPAPPRQASGGTPASAPPSAAPAPSGKLPTDAPWALATAVRPVRVKVLGGALDEAAIWRLFDGRAATGLAPAGRPARFRAELPEPTFVDAVAIFGSPPGAISIEAEGASGSTALMQKAKLTGGGARWNRRDFASAPPSTAVIVTFEPGAPDAAIPELELWGRPASAPPSAGTANFPDALYSGVPSGARELRAREGELTISPATVSAPGVGGTFTVDIDGDPADIDRAFLIYELAGLPHFTATARSINGQRAIGRFGISRGAKGGLQVEEIAPASLFGGRNRIQFFPADERNPESYRVSQVRIVAVPRGATPMTDASARDASALRDGREATGWRTEAGKPADGRRWEFAGATQPWALDFRLPAKGAGTLTVTAGGGAGRDKGQITVKLDGLAAGWHRVPLDKMPATEALTLTLSPGKEETAAISELTVEGSAVPADEAPHMTISYPLSGECVNHRVHVRGFVTPGADALSSGGRRMADGVLGRDGAFAFDLPEKDVAGKGLLVEATYPGGARARRMVSVGRCIDRPPSVVADDGRPRQPTEDVGAPYGVTVRAGQGASLSFAGVKLDIPAGAVEKDVRLTVRPLPAKHVAPLDPGMTNISPDAQAFRLGSHGMVFKKPISVTLPYSKKQIPAGHTEADVRTFYYDETLHRWEQVGLLAQNDGEMVSVTEHFTDFINATIAMPEHPGTQSINPTSLKDMKLADPAAGIALIQAPTANSRGTANLRFPIEVPPGRHGVQPDLAITYDSDRQNGWLGVGWDLSMSSIQVDTRFGVPKYDGSETYLLDGEMLAPMVNASGQPTNPPGAPLGPTYFQRRVEGRFDWIARSGTVATGFTWLVTTKDGVKLSYGSSTGSRLSDPQAANKTFRWLLDRVTDPLQNQMSITYQSDTGQTAFGGPIVGNSEPFVQLYPAQIDYTSHPSLSAAYHVFFKLGGPDGGTTCNRPDTIIDGRPGFQVLTRCLLSQVEVKFQTQFVRKYVLNYDSPLNQGVAGKVFEPGHFGKSLLASIDVKGATGTDAFYSHSFDYFVTPEILGTAGVGTLSALGDPVSWAPLVNLDASARTEEGLTHTTGNVSSFATEGDIGVGDATLGLGASFCLSANDEETFKMIPYVGDGVLDFVGTGGLLDAGALIGRGSFSSRTTPGAYRGSYGGSTANLLPSHTDRDLFSVNQHVLVLSSSADLTNRARQTQTLVDINGDGFPDLVAATKDGMLVRLNDQNNAFLDTQTWANYSLSSNTCDDPLHHAVSNLSSTFLSTVNKVIMSVTGAVAVAGDIAFPQSDSGGSVEALIVQNGQTIWHHAVTAADPPCTPGPGNGCTGGLTLNVQAGDRLYTQLRATDNPNHTVAWSPTFTYQSVGGVTIGPAQANLREPYGAPIYRFDQSADFRLVGRSFATWTAAASGTVNIRGQLSKESTSDDLRVRVVRNTPDTDPIVSFQSILPAQSTSTTPVAIDSTVVAVGDTLSFEVLSDMPIDPGRVHWTPIVTYKTFCATDPESGISSCEDVNCTLNPSSGLPRCGLPQDPIPGLHVSSSQLQQQAVPFFPLFEFQPGTATKTVVIPAAGPVFIGGTITKTSVTPSRVIVAVQGVNALYGKQVLTSNETGTIPFEVTTPSLPAGSQLFFTVYSDSDATGVINWTPTIDGSPQPVTFRSRATGTQLDPSGIGAIELMAGGYHGWSYGLWNAAAPFDETQVVTGATPSSSFFPIFFQQPPVQAPPDDQTLEFCNPFESWSCAAKTFVIASAGGALIPIATQPETILTAATVAPGAYFLTQLGGCGGPLSWASCKSLPALRLTSSTNFDTTLTIQPLSGGVNVGTAASRIDLIDMNGDRYPDAVAKDGTLFNTGTGFETSATNGMALPFGDLRSLSHYNYHIGAAATGTQNFTDAQGRSAGYNISGGLGGGFSYGQSVTATDLVDINGDGLPDHVKGDPATGSVIVRLNLGHRFGNQIIWPGKQWQQQAGNLPDLLRVLGVDPFDADTLRIEDTSANNIQFGLGGGGPFGAGVGGGANGDIAITHTLIRTVVDMVDINGDGLPDQVMKAPGSDHLRVKLNLGAGFDIEKRIPLTDWATVGAPNGLPTGLSGELANLGLGSTNDALGYSIIRATSWTIGTTVSAPCVGIITCSYSGSLTNVSSDTDQTLSFEDVDGDGKVDQVLKADGNAQVFARLNVTGKTNLLRHVSRPLGGTIDLDYQRTGNLLANVLSTRIEMPANQWTLAEVTLKDGRGHTYIDTFDYGTVSGTPDLSSGFYDRVEREDYGYRRVATIHGLPNGSPGIFTGGDGSITERFYENRDFYRKGFLKAEFEEDHTGKIFRGTVIAYKDPATAGLPSRTGVFFPAETDRYTLFYEGSSSNAFAEAVSVGQSAQKAKHEQRFFNANGDLTDLYDFGDAQIIDDDLHYTIVSTNETGTHITRATSIAAIANATDQTLRKRTAIYAPALGTLSTLTNVVSGGRVPGSGTPGTLYNQASSTYAFTYDAFGNLLTSTDPTGYQLKYTYDTTAQTYRTRVDDVSFGYFSTASYDLRFGVPQSSSDVNGQPESYSYDSFGRLCSARGPDDQSTSVFPTIAMSYGVVPTSCPNAPTAGAPFPAYAVTRHKDVQHTNDPIDTVTFIDGLGRVIQTKKDLDVDSSGNGSVATGMSVSGQILFDARGRVSSQAQPSFSTAATTTFLASNIANPTTFTYDELGRQTSMNVPDGTANGILTTMAYEVVNGDTPNDSLGDGRTWLMTEVKDGQANQVPAPPANTGRRLTYADARGNRVAVREYDQIGTSTSLTPLTTKYVYDPLDQLLTVADAKGNVTTAVYDTVGQMVTLANPDAGQTDYRFDLNGNLKEKQTPVLRGQARVIAYAYDFNRLKTITYPTLTQVAYTYGASTEKGDANGNVAGRIKKVSYEAGNETRTYDHLGNANKTVTTLNRMSTTTGLPATMAFTMKYTYDWLGRMQTMTFPNWIDQSFNILAGEGELVTYTYDHGGNIDKITGKYQTANPQQTSVPTSFNYLNHVGYNEFEQRTVLTGGNSIANKYLYEAPTRRLSDINADSRGSQEVSLGKPATPFHRLHYTYDKVGNVTHMVNNVSVRPWRNASVFVGPLDVTYTYDNLYQLRSMSGKYRPHVAYGYQYSDTYTFDEIGNIKTKAQSQDRLVWDNQTVNESDTNPVSTQLAGSRFDHNVAGLTYSLAYTYPSARPHGATPVSETPAGSTATNRAYSYDANGNNTGNTFKTDTRTQVWDEENRLKQVTRNGGSLAQFKYDDAGERKKKQTAAGDSWYVNQYFVLLPGNQPTKHIFAGETRIATKTDAINMQTPLLNYYHPDHLGTTSYTSVASQDLVQHERYFAFGELWRPGGEQEETDLSRPGGARREWLFTSKEWDVDTGLYYFGARYFDPHADVWQSTDPVLRSYLSRGANGVSPKDLGLYSYGWNNPIVIRDPDGRQVAGTAPEYTQALVRSSADEAAATAEENFQIQHYLRRHSPDAGPGPLGVPRLIDPIAELAGSLPDEPINGQAVPTLGPVEIATGAGGIARLGFVGLRAGAAILASRSAAGAIRTLSSAEILFSQSSVRGVEEIAASMRSSGWVGAPVDVVAIEGRLITVDNTRVLAAHLTGTPVQAIVHGAGEALPASMAGRFVSSAGTEATTWGEAVLSRIASQSAAYRRAYPLGSRITGVKP